MSTAAVSLSALRAAPTGAPAGRVQPVAAAGIVLLHLVAVWALLQVAPALREGLAEPLPVAVRLFAPRTEIASTAPALPTPQTPRPPVAPSLALPSIEVIAAPSPVPAPTPPTTTTTLTVVAAEPAASAPRPGVVAPVAPPAPATTEPAEIPPAAVANRVWPDIVYPPATRRLNEAGLVVVAVLINTDGDPAEVRVEQSSGFERLDRAAAAGVRRARFRPYTDGGRARAAWARIPVPFELAPASR
jgi:protein TonB